MIHFPVVKYYAIPQKTAITGYQNMMSAEKEKSSVLKNKWVP